MIRDICKDEAFLAQKAEPATPEDLPVAADLLETLEHHKDGCVGMAANMIGVNKRIIAFDNDGKYMVMFNPEIIKKTVEYESPERKYRVTNLQVKNKPIVVDGSVIETFIGSKNLTARKELKEGAKKVITKDPITKENLYKIEVIN